MATLALIGLGSNLGDRKSILNGAIAALSRTAEVEVYRVSTYHETPPVGGPAGQGAFLNAAAAIKTTLDPIALHCVLREIETQAGRVRVVRWGERSLDLDLLLFGDQVLDGPGLIVPHPRMAVRRFVLAPLAEIAPTVAEPVTMRTIASLLANLDRRPSYVALFRHRCDEKAIFSRLVARLLAVGLSSGLGDGAGDVVQGSVHWQDGAEYYLSLQKQTTTELRRDRWTEELWGDRWIVTDFWFDRIYALARSTMEPRHFVELHDRFLEARSEVIEPTFLVIDRRIKMSEVQTWFGGADAWFPTGSHPPTLRPESDDPDEIVTEIVAACQATRAG